EMLGLPSDFSAEDRDTLNIATFVRQESELRQGAAFDSLASVKIVAKALVSLRDRKRKNDSGVYKNTMSQKQINDTERRRDLHIANYMAARKALMALGEADGSVADFPQLTVEDTIMKSRTLRRQLGDSGRVDGPLWAQGAVSVGDRIQWYRAEAEMERWREQVEMKLAEWRTTIRSFAAYKDAWTQLAAAQNAENIGHIAYAKQKAYMF
ncbi:hypothetical protein C8R44DRAFT_530114, partial [Mycena epipterygia]